MGGVAATGARATVVPVADEDEVPRSDDVASPTTSHTRRLSICDMLDPEQSPAVASLGRLLMPEPEWFPTTKTPKDLLKGAVKGVVVSQSGQLIALASVVFSAPVWYFSWNLPTELQTLDEAYAECSTLKERTALTTIGRNSTVTIISTLALAAVATYVLAVTWTMHTPSTPKLRRAALALLTALHCLMMINSVVVTLVFEVHDDRRPLFMYGVAVVMGFHLVAGPRAKRRAELEPAAPAVAAKPSGTGQAGPTEAAAAIAAAISAPAVAHPPLAAQSVFTFGGRTIALSAPLAAIFARSKDPTPWVSLILAPLCVAAPTVLVNLVLMDRSEGQVLQQDVVRASIIGIVVTKTLEFAFSQIFIRNELPLELASMAAMYATCVLLMNIRGLVMRAESVSTTAAASSIFLLGEVVGALIYALSMRWHCLRQTRRANAIRAEIRGLLAEGANRATPEVLEAAKRLRAVITYRERGVRVKTIDFGADVIVETCTTTTAFLWTVFGNPSVIGSFTPNVPHGEVVQLAALNLIVQTLFECVSDAIAGAVLVWAMDGQAALPLTKSGVRAFFVSGVTLAGVGALTAFGVRNGCSYCHFLDQCRALDDGV